jgi:acetoin utilization protein AcuB
MVKISDIVKTENIIKIKADDTLSSALAKLSTSHDAGFVFSQDNIFLGIINPYYHLIKTSLPGNAKVGHYMFHPPKIYMNYSNAKIAQLMDESKIHYLPVFSDDDMFMGIVSARRLLSHIHMSLSQYRIKELLELKKHPLATVFEEDTVSTALTTFKTSKVSKLIVIDHNNKLRGILSYYDLISYLMAPKDKQHGEKKGMKLSIGHQKVKNFAKSYVLTLTVKDTLRDALNLILDMKIGSVVVIDEERHPIGIITTKDFLKLLVKNDQAQKIEIITKNLSQKSRQVVGGFFNHFSDHLKHVPDVMKAKLLVKEEKEGNLFKVVLSLIPKRGLPQIIHREGRDLHKVLKEIKK